MATRSTVFTIDEIYHVYNRGNSKQAIYLSQADYERFLMLMHLSNTTAQFNIRDVLKITDDIFSVEKPDRLVRIGAYCLMPNHFHLLLSPVTEGGLSKFLLKLCTGYTMYFNTKYERAGTLYEGSFKSKHVDSDEYLKYLFSYIHLNPVSFSKEIDRFGIKNESGSNKEHEVYSNAIQYPYSSLHDFLPIDPDPKVSSPRGTLGLIDKEVYQMYFTDSNDVRNELFDWLRYEEYEEPALGEP